MRSGISAPVAFALVALAAAGVFALRRWGATGPAWLLAYELGLIALPTLLAAHRGGGVRTALSLRRCPAAVLVLAAVAGLAALLALAWLLLPVQSALAPAGHRFARTFGAGMSGDPVLALALALVTAAVAEEFLFRGALLGALRPALGGAGAVVVAAGLFAVLHPLIRLPSTLAFGVLLGTLVVLHASTLPAIVAHAVFNLGLASTLTAPGAAATRHLDAHWHAVGGTATVVLTGCVVLSWRLRRP